MAEAEDTFFPATGGVGGSTPTGIITVAAKRPVFSEINDWLASPSFRGEWDLTKVTIPRFLNVTPPGIMIPGDKKILGDALVQHFKALVHVDAGENAEFNAMQAILQLMVTFSASRKTRLDAGLHVVSGNNKLMYSDMMEVVSTVQLQGSYDNILRSFGRSLSSTVILLLTEGYLEPNIKVANDHAIPPEYYPYSPDFIVVDGQRWGADASLAALLGKLVAFNMKSAGARGVHSNLELAPTAAAHAFRMSGLPGV